MSRNFTDEHERSAGGMDFDDAIRDQAATLGASLLEGPERLLEQVEELLPEHWRDQIASFPVSALLIGFGVGIFLGAKKGDELIAAGSSLVTAAVAANLNNVVGQARGE